MSGERRCSAVAIGYDKGLMKRIVISMDDETFATVRQRAVKSGHSFGAEARLLIAMGLETMGVLA